MIPKIKDYKENIRSMKIGVQGSFYPVPAEVDEESAGEWQLRRVAALGCTVHQIRHLPKDRGRLLELKKLAQSLSVELELAVTGAFNLTGPYADREAKERFLQMIGIAKSLEVPVVRTGYGRLNVRTSRFNRDMSVRDHLQSLLPSLREAGRIAQDAGLLLAVENHCDFTGREMAWLLEAVGSDHVGAALDTANGFTVFSDPKDDIEALAPFTFTTHMKDMVVVDSPVKGIIPMIPQGCALGEGHVDLSYAVDLLAEKSPCAQGLHLIVEPGWMVWDPDRDVDIQAYEFFEKGVRYLQHLQFVKAGEGNEK